MPTELTTNEKMLLAREIAIDQHGYRNYGLRAFTDGWDAALLYVEEQRRLDDRAHWQESDKMP